MTRIDVSLPEPMQRWIQHRVESGLYADASDYVRDLIRHDQGRAGVAPVSTRLEAAIAVGLADLDAGRVFDADEVFDALETKYGRMIAAETTG